MVVSAARGIRSQVLTDVADQRGKFFESSKVHETLYRGVYYTNYRFRSRQIETPVGILLPSTTGPGLSTLTYEVVERIEAYPGARSRRDSLDRRRHCVNDSRPSSRLPSTSPARHNSI